jgi:hypothetical protein
VSLSFDNLLLTVHIGAALIAFGVMLAYPVLLLIGNSVMEPEGLPLFHRAQLRVIQRLVNPGLAAVVASGLVLALDLGTLGTFYAKWGIVAAIVLGAITGAYLGPREARLAQMAERDLRADDDSVSRERDLSADSGALSREYHALSSQVSRVTGVASLIVLATLLVMICHT